MSECSRGKEERRLHEVQGLNFQDMVFAFAEEKIPRCLGHLAEDVFQPRKSASTPSLM